MSFLKSVSNQIGRDLGKAISNSFTSDNSSFRQNSKNYNPTQTDFQKAITFPLSTGFTSLLNKLTNAYSVMKKEINKFISDGYLDNFESNKLFNMLVEFNTKCDDISELLSLDENNNTIHINRLITLQSALKLDFINVLKISIKGCERNIYYLENSKVNIWKYIGYHIIFMGKYVKGNSKNITKTILSNFLSLLIFPIAQIFMAFKGVITFKKYIKNIDTKITFENNRILIFTELILSNS